MKTLLAVIVGLTTLAGLGYGVMLLSETVQPPITAAAITAVATVLVSTATIALGRYLEKKKELEALHREKKVPIYGKFLEGLFSIFYERKGKQLNIVKFLQEWQQKIVLWGGPTVVNAYIDWKTELTAHEPNVKTMETTDKLIHAIRQELGHKDRKLKKGIFPRFILREADLYFQLAKQNPNLTLAELAARESEAATEES